MANRYWVGGTAAWDGTAGTKWSLTSGGPGGEAVPTSADDVFFSSASTGTCTISAGNTGAKSINCTGFTGTLTGTAAITVSGSVTLVAGMTYTYTGTLTINATSTLTSGGKTHGSITFDDSGGTLTLGDACTLGATNTFTLTKGTLDLGGFTLSTGIFSSSNTSTRAITFGSANIALTSTTAATTVLSMATASSFTMTTSGGGFTRNQAATATMVFGTTGGTASNAPNLTVNAGSSTLTFTVGSYFKNLVFTGSSCTAGNSSTSGTLNIAGNLTLATGGTYPGASSTNAFNISFIDTATFTTNGKSIGNIAVNGSGITVTLNGNFTGTSISSGGSTFSLTQGTFDAGTYNVTAGGFSSSNTNVRTLNMGTGTWTLNGLAVFWFISDPTNLTLNPGTSTIKGTNGLTFTGGGLTYYNLEIASATTIQGSNTFNDITNGIAAANANLVITAGTTQTLTNFSYSATAPYSAFLVSSTVGSTYTLSKASGTVNVSRLLIRDSIATGGATWNATSSVNLGNNTGWNITASTGRYWVGGTASWDGAAGTKWATSSGAGGGATVPGLVDPAYFDAASGVNTVTIASGNLGCAGFICTGFTGTFSGTAALNVYGDITISAGMTPGWSGTLTVLGPCTLISAGKQLNNLAIGSSATAPGAVTLGDALSLPVTAASPTLTLTAGSLSLNDFTLTTGTLASSNSNTRSINFGTTGSIILSATTAGATVVSMATATNFTFTGTSNISAAMVGTKTFNFGGTAGATTSNRLNINLTSGAGAPTFTGSFRQINFTGTTSAYGGTANCHGFTLASGGTYTSATFVIVGTGTLTANGKAFTALTINAPGATATLQDNLTVENSVATTVGTTLTAGTLDLNNFSLTTNILSSDNSNTRAIAFGTTGFILLTATSPTVVLAMATATNFTFTGTSNIRARLNGAEKTFRFGNTAGATASNRLNIGFINTGTPSTALTFTGSFRQIDFTASTLTVTAVTINCHGFTLASGGTYNSPTFNIVGDGTLTFTGKAIGQLIIDGSGITSTLASAGQTLFLTLVNGTLDLNGYTLTSTSTAATSAGTKDLTFNGGTLVCSAASATAWNNSNPTGFTTTAGTGTGTISMTAATAKSFNGGGSTYNCTLNQGGAGTLTITGANTFNNIANTNATASQITFPANTTTTVNNFTLSGSAGNLVSIRTSSMGGNPFTLSKSSGTVSVSFLDIQDSNATGGASWQAYFTNGNVDSGNNTGWMFSPSTGFLAFFVP